MNNPPNPRHSVSLITATAIVVANIIGTGVFTSLGFQVAAIPSGFALLSLWAIGGICALCGALAYGELAAALPRSGGEYHFLSTAFHPAVGFVAGWTSATIGFAAPIALSAMAFGQYSQSIVPGVSPLAMSVAVASISSLVHLYSVRAGSVFQNAFTWVKVILISAFIVAGFAFGHPQSISFAPRSHDLHLVFSTPFAVSLVYVMYAYSGWNASTYIIGEVQNPQRNVPRSLLMGTAIVALLYIGLNWIFLYTTPIAKLTNQLQVGVIAGTEVFGRSGGRFMGALICLVLISCISSMTWIGPRVAMAMGEDFRVLKLLAWKTKSGVPAVAVVLQLCIVNALLFTTTFEVILIYIQFTLILCSFLTVLAVMALRITHPDWPRPYKIWGYPFPPLIFLGITFWMMISVMKAKPIESLSGLGTMMLGLLVYFALQKRGEREEGTSSLAMPAVD